MLGFNGKTKSNSKLSSLTERELMEKIYVEVLDLKEKIEELEEIFGGDEGASEYKTLKAELKDYNKFMKELVLRSFDTMKERASKPTAAELYAANKNAGATLSMKELSKSQVGSSTQPKLP